ncbi:hypothetical protein ANCCEY_11299 [Ancylostoma ceylanicum]|uniref:Uncharacterized protein n=1 Tax=Ancylostoma ceylanicum TaxID=53326 RepID=A0A0D6LPM6_9BILA|nr:hypothetical protein ANCCEY_11299 [Ancylostoma ceylanicum]
MFYIDSLKYYDKPNYAVLRGLLRDALDSNALSEYPYDWEANAVAQKPLHLTRSSITAGQVALDKTPKTQ